MAQFTSFANLKEQREANKKKFCDVSINVICKQLNCTWYDLYIYLYNDEALWKQRNLSNGKIKQKGVKGNQARKYPVLILANFDLSQTYYT